MADELNTAWNAAWHEQNGEILDAAGNPAPDADTPDPEGQSHDRLSQDGILRHGYGLIPKYAMQDRELTIIAKSIYAYLCSLCGGGETAFPSVDTIRAALNLGKESYYQHRRLLEAAGYITVEHRHLGRNYTTNLYTLNENPRRFQQYALGEWEDRIFSSVRCSGLWGAGYGVLPRVVMTDPRLDAKAKAVYAYFASLTGSGSAAFPSRTILLRDLHISHDSYYKYLNQLKETGYLATRQRVTCLRFSVNEYYLLDNAADPAVPTAEEPAIPAMTPPSPQTPAPPEPENLEHPFQNLDRFTNYGIMVNPCPKNPDTMEGESLEHPFSNLEHLSIDVENFVENSPGNVENKVMVNPCPKNPDTMEGVMVNPCPKNPDTMEGVMVNPCPNFPYTKNPDTTNNKIYTNFSYSHLIYLSNYSAEIFEQSVNNTEIFEQSVNNVGNNADKAGKERQEENPTQPDQPPQISPCQNWQHWKEPDPASPANENPQADSDPNPIFRREEVEQKLKQSLGYYDIPIMYPKQDMKLIDNLVGLMVSALCDTTKPFLRLGQKTYSLKEMHRRFMSLNVEHLRYVLDCVNEADGNIRNPKAYYLASLLNAPDTMNLYYERKVKEDMRNW